MPPVRRYLRVTRRTVLEVRIYLDDPADAQRWLLHASNPALPRVIEAVRPLILPKLREEDERTNKGGRKKKRVKDVVARDDFEVSVFLTNLSTPHSILTRRRIFQDKTEDQHKGTKDAPLRVEEDDDSGPNMLLREDDDEPTDPNAVPPVKTEDQEEDGVEVQGVRQNHVEMSGEEVLRMAAAEVEGGQDDKKKMGLQTFYDGSRIYGRVLCLVVKRTKGDARKEDGTGQAMLEQWISSTQESAWPVGD